MNHNPFTVDVYYNETNNNTPGTKPGSLSANDLSWTGDEVFDFRTFYYIYFVNPATGEKNYGVYWLRRLLVNLNIIN